MNKRAAQSGVLHLRVLIGMFIMLPGVVLALAGFGIAQAQQKQFTVKSTNSIDPLVPPGFDCSKIHDLGIDKQVNLRAGAIMIFCGEAQGGSASPARTSSRFIQRLLQPLAYGTMDVDLITGTETYPHVTQSTTFTAGNPDNLLQIVVTYNDARGINVNNSAGVSVSTDGGNTFTRLTINGQSPFPNCGSPIIVYNRPSQTWFIACNDGSCGGIGGYKSTTPWDPNSWIHYCIYTSTGADRESGWADNNPSSPFYGRMYVSWNDFTRGQNIFLRYSTDNGLTWTNERQITATFIRNVQITGDKVTGAVYIAGMDEGGGGCGTTRANKLYRSTDGGNTWTNTYNGPTFIGPCRTASGYFATMYDNPAYWRYMGWGEPAAYNGVVSYVYAAKNGSDPGDVFYIRSTDMGVTFSAPFQLNTNTDPTKAQWEPNLSASDAGTLLATWYDETPRIAASCQPSSPGTPCYQIHSRKSNDNGVTWLADDTLSDVASPLPLQPDPGIVAIYVSDCDYSSSVINQHLVAWVDGRVTINGISQMDAFFDREPPGAGTPTPTPSGCSVTSTACGSIIVGSAPTDFIVNLSSSADPASVQGNDLMVNGTPANIAMLSNGNTTITFHFNTSPAVQGQNTMHIPAGAFDCGNGGVQEFTCTFTYEPTPTPTVTPTTTPSTTPTATATATPTPTPKPTPTPRPDLTPRTRPTPPPR
jgi:hypothetical protein